MVVISYADSCGLASGRRLGMWISFFCSSRRRHTSFDCDWSSDVCSSDLRHDFERHLEAASAVAARRGTVHDLFAGIVGPPPVLLTFDDGGASAYGCVADLLERAGWRGHFFITTDYLGTPGFVGRAQVRELAGRGHVIGTHSCSHPARMARCRWDRLIDEGSRSAPAPAHVLGEPVRGASGPGGAHSPRV